MYPTTGYPSSAPRFAAPAHFRETFDRDDAPHAPQDIRPLITRHRLRRQRRRKAATLLTGASIALGVAALRPSNAAAHSGAASQAPITHADRHTDHDPVPVQHAAHAPITYAAVHAAQNPALAHHDAHAPTTHPERHPTQDDSVLAHHSVRVPTTHAARLVVQNPTLAHHSAPG